MSASSAGARTPRFNFVKPFSPNFSFSPKKTNSNNNNKSNNFNSVLTRESAMYLFHKAKAVRLRSHHDKYLHAEDDESTVSQDRHGSSKNARWTVEPVPGADTVIRLKSRYGKYLTASNQPFLLGMTGRKVLQTAPARLDSSVEWEPIREGAQMKLMTRHGSFLRANGGLPPWRNSVTHDIPHRTATQEWVLWEVDVVDILVAHSPVGQPKPAAAPQHQDSLDFKSSTSVSPKSAHYSRQESSDAHSPVGQPKSAAAPQRQDSSDFESSTSVSPRSSPRSSHYSRQESSDSYVGSPPKSEGRTIKCHVAD